MQEHRDGAHQEGIIGIVVLVFINSNSIFLVGEDMKKVVCVILVCLALSGCNTTIPQSAAGEPQSVQDHTSKPDMVAIVDAYNFSWNLELWNSTDSIKEEWPKIADIYEGDNEYDYGGACYTYYFVFKGNDSGNEDTQVEVSAIDYRIEQQGFVSHFVDSDFDGDIDSSLEEWLYSNNLRYVGQTAVGLANPRKPVFPKAEPYKSDTVELLKKTVTEAIEDKIGKGEYRVYIQDFLRADTSTEVMVEDIAKHNIYVAGLALYPYGEDIKTCLLTKKRFTKLNVNEAEKYWSDIKQITICDFKVKI